MTASGLWRRHGRGGLTQAERLVELLREARGEGRAVLLPEIMALGIAQHGARLSEIRHRGFRVENEVERGADGRVLSRYRLTYDPSHDPVPEQKECEHASRPFPEFGDLTIQERHRDDG